MACLVEALHAYAKEYGGFPPGSNAAVTAALHGANPKKIIFMMFRPQDVDADGACCDSWGTPYEIGIIGQEITIRSAGPNKRLDKTASTDDDWVIDKGE
jgi:hypothetical protein